ncbi:Uncharacterised protein [Mycobacteroides abscessus subsp. abscessus]|uniref:DUF429 domain-containing protein n=1 Tax=Mycobacteroides immunogenum TaxID=83262 RepID=A0A7V8LKI6_9MYCO|nr:MULTISPECIES: hypothetical protein [Mycobacteroides]AMT70559.1 hypothetical protein ABG82_09790 [Mycobacteroides immunogenum]ANO03645.1 hypothetical protein BAB75_09845 [Mycobacteroides immunogenum]KIU38487.1 hypothetical protein TL11_21820 [Mycobacteroides immunogenum]KPG04304.1 hypothetical protein AN909_23925 [Mycobacteroides immunogenum]KPG04779.1 hypothetical protein AN908_23290 [Mycobacteroides immunogenum]
MSRFVVGLDCVVTGVSIAAFVEGAPSPVTRFVRAPRIDNFDVMHQTARTLTTAEMVMESVLRSGVPDLVVMMKPSMGDARKDTSAPRRMMLVGEIQRRLVEAGIPVAEVSAMTLVDWLLGSGRKYPPRDFSGLEQAVRGAWNPGETDDGFRLTTVGVAAAAAVVAGISTRKSVENSSLAALSEMSLPSGWELPARASEWNKLHVKSEVA